MNNKQTCVGCGWSEKQWDNIDNNDMICKQVVPMMHDIGVARKLVEIVSYPNEPNECKHFNPKE